MKVRPARLISQGPRATGFGETNWWVVRKAGQPRAKEVQAARESLCQIYWGPIFSYVRHLGYGLEDAQDLTQGFFARMLEKNYVQTAARKKGRFRSFLLVMLKRFLADQLDRTRRQKRGCGKQTVSISSGDTEFRSRIEPADQLTPEMAYERNWAQSVLALALDRLEQDMAARGRRNEFTALKPVVTCEGEATYAEVAQALGWSTANLKVTVHRLRRRLGALLKKELAKTGATTSQIEAEIQDLFAAFR